MLSIILVLESLEILLVSIFRIFNKIKLYSFFQILEIFLTFFLVSYFILLDYGIIGAIMGLLISKVIVFSGSMLYVVSEIGICVPRFINTKKYLNYGIPLIFSPISNWILNSSDRYMITILLGISFVRILFSWICSRKFIINFLCVNCIYVTSNISQTV